MSKFTFRFKLVLMLVMSIWMAGLSQTVFEISGNVQDQNQLPQEGIEIWITGISSQDSVIYSTITNTDGNGDYQAFLTFLESEAVGVISVSMIDCFGVFLTQQFFVNSEEPHIVADFIYCSGIITDSCATFITFEKNPSGIGELAAWSLPGIDVEYEWNTGETTPSIIIEEEGVYCVSVTYPWGCVAESCIDATVDTNSFCFSYIVTTPNGNGLFDLEVISLGEGPFTYIWTGSGETEPILHDVPEGTYCVEVTDEVGCVYTACAVVDDVEFCEAFISEDTAGVLTVIPFGVSPFNFSWSTGQTTQSIVATEPGLYCVTVVDASGCETNTCYQIVNHIDSCYVFINAIADENEGLVLYAFAGGWPNDFAFQWSTGESSQSITVTNFNEPHCVTVTNSEGCTSTACFDINDLCYGWVNSVYVDTNTALLEVITDPALLLPGMPPLEYIWSNGETSPTITVAENGSYCVTVTNGNCTIEACEYIDFDSIANSCVVYVFQYLDTLSGEWQAQANAFGLGQFDYLWSTGETTPSIPLDLGEFACVTITSSVGCVATACVDTLINPCKPWISIEQISSEEVLLTAYSQIGPGQPGSYLWSTGDTTSSIIVTEYGTYCVSIETQGCVGETCVFVNIDSPDTCGVWIETSVLEDQFQYTAHAFGEAPFSYTWSSGDISQVVLSDGPISNLCVTVTDDAGCIATDCNDPVFDTCSLVLVTNPAWGNYILAVADQPINYIVWSTGDTTNWISIAEPGTYCATAVSLLGCTSFSCITIDSVAPGLQNSINGFVRADSSSQIEAKVYVWHWDDINETYDLVDSTEIDTNAFYSFSNLPNGVYIVRAVLTENSSGYGNYMPTYHLSSPFWELADPIQLPNWLPVTNDVWMIPGQPLQGPGGIGGAVVDPAGILGEEHFDTRGVEGIGGIVVVLRNATGDVLQFRVTDQNGLYHFDNLPLGTYQLSYDITGITSPVIWVTLTDNEHDINNVILPVSTTVSTDNPVVTELSLYPNPGTTFVQIPVPTTLESVQVIITDMQGRVVYSMKTSPSVNGVRAEVADLAPGLYQIIVTANNQQYIGKWVKQSQ